MDNLLDIQDLRGGYGGAEVLRGVSLSVRPREVVALLGANGAGKSTLNNTVCGLLPASSGRVLFDDQDLTRARPAQIVAAGLVQVPEGRRIFENLSVRENLALGCYRRGRDRRADSFERALAAFPRLAERLGQRAGSLSGGEQQMLAIGRGLMADPRLLILDEPSLGLSPLLAEEMFRLIAGLNREGLAIVLVEQNVSQSLAIAHRACVLEHGSIVFQGTPAALLANAGLKRACLGMA